MDTVFRLLEAHKERVMEDSGNFAPSRKAVMWSIALSTSNAALAFSLIAAPIAAPVLGVATIFTLIKSQRIFSEEIRNHKNRENKKLIIQTTP